MNFGYTVNGLVKGRKITVTIWDRKTCVRLSADEREKLREIIDTFGWNSAQAQGLSRPVTDYNRLKTSDHRLYLICKPHWVRGSRVIGGLKCGKKHLYFRRDDSEGYQECEPMCVLDFYIHERYQRKGLGRRLFKAFLENEEEEPSTIAYDKPTPKLVNFLKKYYGKFKLIPTRYAQQHSSLQCASPGMARSVQQNNNFMVFDTFFDKTKLISVKHLVKRCVVSNGLSKISNSGTSTTGHRHAISPLNSRETLTPTSVHNSPKSASRKSTTTASSSILSRADFNKLSKASITSVDSIGKPSEPFSRATGRPPIRPTTMRVASNSLQHGSAPARLPMGPYPGWQPSESLPRMERKRRKDSTGLTRLTPIQSPSQDPPTPACRCIPPWATGLSADRTTGIVKKIVTVSAISPPRHGIASTEQSKSVYEMYKNHISHSAGAKSCLTWTQR